MGVILYGGKTIISKLFILVIFCLLINSNIVFAVQTEPIGASAPKLETSQLETKGDIFNLALPSSWGRIREVYKGSSGYVVVHIQDAHCNYEAQTNIAKILDRLVSNYNVKVAGIEGASGRLQTELFSTFPDEEIRAQATDYFVKEGRLSGPEALVIREGFEYPLELYGIEDSSLYANNFKAFETSFPFKNEAKGYFSKLNRALTELKSFLYSPELAGIDAKQIAFENKEIELNEYCQFLAQVMEKQQINLKDFPNFAKLQEAINVEKEINFAQAEEERTKLLTELTNILPEEDIRALVDKGLAYKNESINASTYLAFIKELALNNKVDFTQYKNLDKYIDYAKNYDYVNTVNLFQEMAQIEDALRAKLYTAEEQKKLDTLVKGLKVMERLVDIKMVNKDLSFYQEHKDGLKTDKYLDYIKSQAANFKLNLDLPVDISYLDVYIPAWVDFYKVACMRDSAMIDNTLKLMDEKNQKIVVMVTGGFHTRELTNILRSKDISYLVITPRITQNVESPYFNLLTGKKTPLDNFIEQINEIAKISE